MKHTNQIDVPLIFFSLAFFIVLVGLFSRYSFQQKKYVDPEPRQSKKITNTKQNIPSTLNYNEPLMCNYQANNATLSAALKGNAVGVIVMKDKTEKRYVLEADCVFSWTSKELVGKKQCGVGQYMSIGKQLLSSGLASADSLAAMATQAGKSIPFDIGSLLQTCRNVKDVEKSMFTLPKNVVFK